MSNNVKMIEIQDMNNVFHRVLNTIIFGKKNKKEIFDLRIHKKEENIEELDIEKRIKEIVDFFKDAEKKLSDKETKTEFKESLIKSFPIELHDTLKLIVQVMELLISNRIKNGLISKKNEKIEIIPILEEDQLLTFDSFSWRKKYLKENKIEELTFEGVEYDKEEIELPNEGYKQGRIRIDLMVLNIIREIYTQHSPERVFYKEGYEADDFHGILTRKYMKLNEKSLIKYNVSIVTTDNDQNQLANYTKQIENTEYGKIVKINPKEINNLSKKFAQKVDLDSLFEKICIGDNSDNIPSIIPNVFLGQDNLKNGIMGEKGLQKEIDKIKKENQIEDIQTEEDFEMIKKNIIDFYTKKYQTKIIKKLFEQEEKKEEYQKLERKEKSERKKEFLKDFEKKISIGKIKEKMNEIFDKNRYIIDLREGLEDKIERWTSKDPEKEKQEKELIRISPKKVDAEIEDFTKNNIELSSNKESFIKIGENTHLFFKSIKTNKNILELYSAETGILIKTYALDDEKAIIKFKKWIQENQNDIFNKLQLLNNNVENEISKKTEKQKEISLKKL